MGCGWSTFGHLETSCDVATAADRLVSLRQLRVEGAHMRTLRRLLSAAAVILAGCVGPELPKDPTSPDDPQAPVPRVNAPPAVTNPACAPTSAPAIEAQIHALYIKNAW